MLTSVLIHGVVGMIIYFQSNPIRPEIIEDSNPQTRAINRRYNPNLASLGAVPTLVIVQAIIFSLLKFKGILKLI